MKNNIIYSGSVNSAFAEILRLFEKYGHEILYLRDIVDSNSDPFRPRELAETRRNNTGAPKKNGAKFRIINLNQQDKAMFNSQIANDIVEKTPIREFSHQLKGVTPRTYAI